MALPHLQPTYSARPRDVLESQMISRRIRESSFRDMWNHTSDYFSKKTTEADKKTAWESQKSFQSSMDAYKALQEKDAKLLNLQKRRKRLADLLAEEREQLHAELKDLSVDQYGQLTERKAHCDQLRSAREEKRKKVAEEKLYEHWRANSSDVRQLESLRQQQNVVDNWSTQMEIRREVILQSSSSSTTVGSMPVGV